MLVLSTARLCPLNLSLRRFLVSPIYCKLQRLQGFRQIFGRTNFYLGVKRPHARETMFMQKFGVTKKAHYGMSWYL